MNIILGLIGGRLNLGMSVVISVWWFGKLGCVFIIVFGWFRLVVIIWRMKFFLRWGDCKDSDVDVCLKVGFVLGFMFVVLILIDMVWDGDCIDLMVEGIFVLIVMDILLVVILLVFLKDLVCLYLGVMMFGIV